MPADEKAHRFNSTMVQAGRGLAAMTVVFYHAASMYALPKYGAREVWAGWGEVGRHGVDFFFVLSGFIIYMAHSGDVGVASRLGRYVKRRLIRIYPVYWLFLSGFLALAAIGLASAPIAHRPIDLVSAYSLIRLSPEKPPLWVAWTLFHEIVFYAMFAALIASRRWGLAVFGCWLALIVGIHVSRGAGAPTFWSVIYDAINLEFFMGIAVALVVARIGRSAAWLFVVAGTGILLATAVSDHLFDLVATDHLWTLAYGLSSAVILAGLVALELNGAVRSRGLLQIIGAATFSIYLAHSIILSICYHFVAHVVRSTSAVSELVPVAAACIAILLGTIAHFIVERPTIDILRRRFEASSGRRPQVSVPA